MIILVSFALALLTLFIMLKVITTPRRKHMRFLQRRKYWWLVLRYHESTAVALVAAIGCAVVYLNSAYL